MNFGLHQVSGPSGGAPGPVPRVSYIAASESHSEGYQKLHRYCALCDSSGAFRIPDVPVGTYTLEIQLREDHAKSISPHDGISRPRRWRR